MEAIFFIQFGFYGICLILIIYLIIRRIKLKKTEDFEDRDN